MTDPLPVQCTCGSVRGIAHDLRPATVNRVICYCRSCATYADVLGRSEDMLDARRGSDIFQMSPRALELLDGHEHIACLRLTDTGAMRFYASCCNTPIANTLAKSKLPFLGVSALMVPWQTLGETRDEVLGPIAARVNGKFSDSEAAAMKARLRDLLAMLARFAPMFFRWRLRGDQAHSPLLDETGAPIVEPVRVSPDTPLNPRAPGSAPH